MGVANRAVAGALARRGHAVVAVDDNPSDQLRADADALGITLGSSDELADLSPLPHSSSRPRSPEQHEAFAIADAAGVAVVSEFDLAAVWDDGRSSPSPAPTARRPRSSSRRRPRSRWSCRRRRREHRHPARHGDRRSQHRRLRRRGIVVSTCPRRRFRPTVATWLNFAPIISTYTAASKAMRQPRRISSRSRRRHHRRQCC